MLTATAPRTGLFIIACLCLPLTSLADDIQLEEVEVPAGQTAPNWIDTTHDIAAESAQELTTWLDDFFGDPEYDVERAESFLRLETGAEWDQEDGKDFGVKLRGQVQLPKISRRLKLVFAGEDSDSLDDRERQDEDRIGLALQLGDRDRKHARLDATLNYSSGGLVPGVRYRFQGAFSDLYSYRLTERIQYENEEDFFSTTYLDLNRRVGENGVWRWSNRLRYGQQTNGAEWRTNFALRQLWQEDTERPFALRYFASVQGYTRDVYLTQDYTLGMTFRRQIYRDYLFFEFEPAHHWRRREPEDNREGQWSVELRLEMALSRDLAKVFGKDSLQ